MHSQVVVESGCLKPAELTRLYTLPYIPLALISLVTFSPYCRPWADMGDSVVPGKWALSKDTNQRQMGKQSGNLLPLVLWRVRDSLLCSVQKSPRHIVPLSSNYWKIPSPLCQLLNKEGSNWEAAYACSLFCKILNVSFLTQSLRAGRHPRNTSHTSVRGSVRALTSGLWWQLQEIAEKKCTYVRRIGTLDKEITSPPCRIPTGSHCSQNVVCLSLDPNTLACAVFTPELSSLHSKKLISVQAFLPCQILSYQNFLTQKVFSQTVFDDLQ